jgi:hypothetical protein
MGMGVDETRQDQVLAEIVDGQRGMGGPERICRTRLGDQAVLQAQRAVAVVADRLRSRHGGISLEVQDLPRISRSVICPYLSVSSGRSLIAAGHGLC